MTQEQWTDPAWLAGVHEWIDARLAELGRPRTGDITQPHVVAWSTVLRVPVGAEWVWFKANAGELRHEAAVVQRLALRRPDAVPPLLAADTDTGWMLMADAGEMLRTVIPREGNLHRWLDALGLYAGVQLDLAGDVEELLSLGVPDLRLATLPEKFEQLVSRIDVDQRARDAVSWVAQMCEELAAYGIPETLQHDDLHDGQVFVQGDRHLLMDWGDACISHPFFTLSVAFEGGIAWGVDDVEGSEELAPYRDAYLAPYRERYAGDLDAAMTTALRLGWACRVVNGHLEHDPDQTRTRLRMMLDGRP